VPDISTLDTGEYEDVFREPREADFILAWICLLFGLLGVACEFLIPWFFDVPGAVPRPRTPFYVMAYVGPSVGILGIITYAALRRRFLRIRPETTPRKMLAAGFVLSFVPLAVGLGTLFVMGMTSGGGR
jgi:hypothetical protein